MANKIFQGRIIQKHDTKANWDKATNFVPLKGEIIVYDDLKKIKIGDGSTTVINLPYSTITDYNDLSNKPTIGNGTLTIQKNGETVDTFTANATADKTINIEVPTTYKDLQDDESFVINITSSGTSASDLTYSSDQNAAAIIEAINSGKYKNFYALYNYKKYPLTFYNVQFGTFDFIRISGGQGATGILDRIVMQKSKISKKEYPLELQKNKIAKILSSSTDDQYPSAKAVYTELQNYLPLTGGTITGDIDTSNNNINNIKSLSFKDKLNENETPLYGYIINNAGRLETAGMRPDGDYTLMFDTYTSDEPEALIEHLRSEGESMPIITLRNIAEPLTRYDAANKKYVDDQMAANSGSTTIITWSDDGT